MTSMTSLVAIPSGINPNLSAARQATMLSLLGSPRTNYSQSCQPVTNPVLKRLVVSSDVGPFKVTGLAPAVESLKQVLAAVRDEQPQVHAALGTAGMLCARNVRNSFTSVSNHSWGCAIDLNLDGVLDTRGDGLVQYGLTLIAPIFNRFGWFWGAAFGTEDGMHFECSDQLVRRWAGEGLFASPQIAAQLPHLLTLGDRGPEVEKLQAALNRLGGAGLKVDGMFGQGTLQAVMAFQGSHGLTPDGAVGDRTWQALTAP